MKYLFLATHMGLKTQSFFLPPMLLCARTMQLVGYFTQRTTRSVARVFLENDPLWVMSGSLYEADNLVAEIDVRMNDLGEMMRACEYEIKIDNLGQLSLNSHNQQKVLNYEQVLDKLRLVYSGMVQAKTATQFLLKDMSSLLRIKFIKRNTLKSKHSIKASAWSILRGEPIAKEAFDLENRCIAEEYATRISNISEFLHIAYSFIRAIDMQTGIVEPQAMSIISDWDKTVDRLSKISGRPKIFPNASKIKY